MDKILQMFFEHDRWIYAIEKGCVKDVPKNWLYQLCKPEVRVRMYQAIANGTYEIAPPHTAQIPKDTPGEFRTVYVNEPADRVLLSIANDLLFELMPDMIHPNCKSYLKGIGCGRVVQEISRTICDTKPDSEGCIGWKADLSKYFDSVAIEYIERAFDAVEARHGHSALIDVLRKYYHSDWYIDGETKEVCSKYQSLKQGCSVASWLADVVLYHIDARLADMDVLVKRYSDDICCIGPDHREAYAALEEELAKMGMRLNPKKVEWLSADRWFKFLGYSIKGASISLSATRIKKFQKEIEARTIKRKKNGQWSMVNVTCAVNAVNRYLYKGDGQGHSWATQVLSVVNVKQDIDTMNAFVMDCLRAVHTGKTKIGGLGYDKQGKVGCIVRGRGRNVSANRRKTGDDIGGYLTLGCMQNAMRTSKAAYETLVRGLFLPLSRGSQRGSEQADSVADQTTPNPSYSGGEAAVTAVTQTAVTAVTAVTAALLPVCAETIEQLYDVYKHSIPSERTMHRVSRFKALPESELTDDDMLYGVSREQAEKDLEKALQGFVMPDDAGTYFWQSPNDPDLVVLRSWTKELTADERFQRAMISIEEVA